MPSSARVTVVIGSAQINNDGSQWIEVIPTVEKARNGPWFFTITSDDLATYAASIAANPGLIPVDYDHTEGTGTVAAGWFSGETAVVAANTTNPAGETQDHESLWALVKWTPRAVQEIRDGHYKRLSPEFTFTDRDAKTGLLTKAKEIIASTLTNRPFFKELAPVGAEGDVVWERSAGYQSIRDRLGAALNPPDAADGDVSWRYWVCDIDVAGLKALVEDSHEATTYVVAFTLDTAGEPVPAPQAEWVEAEQEWVSAAKAAESRYVTGREATTEGAEMDTTVLAKSLGLADDATEEQITTAITEQAEKAAKADTLAAEVETLKTGGDKSELEELRDKLAVETKKRVDTERETVLATATSEGRMLPAEKDILVEAFGDNVDGLKKVLDARPKNAVLARERGSSEGGIDGDVDTTVEGKKFESEDPVDEDSLTLHAKAVEILTKDGKGDSYTEDEYLAAIAKAERSEQVTA